MEGFFAGIAVGALGNAAGEVIKQGGGFALDWIRDRFGEHFGAAGKQAEENALAYFQLLVDRLKRLEDEVDQQGILVHRALRQPSFIPVYQDATKAAAQTDQKDRHELIVELLVQRIQADEDTTEQLGQDAAIVTLPKLTNKQIQILGGYAAFYQVGTAWPQFDEMPDQEFISNLFKPYEHLQVEPLDQLHLASQTCLLLQPEFASVYSSGDEAQDNKIKAAREFCKLVGVSLETPNLDQVNCLFEEGAEAFWLTASLAAYFPSSAGRQIGVTSHNLNSDISIRF